MADIVPPPSAPPATIPAAPSSQTAVAQDPPGSISSLPIGASLNGLIISSTPEANLIEVQTDLGKILFQSNAQLDPSDQVQLILQKKSPQFLFSIRLVDTAKILSDPAPSSPTTQISSSHLEGNPTVGSGGVKLAPTGANQASLAPQYALAQGHVKMNIGTIVSAHLLNAPKPAPPSNQTTNLKEKSDLNLTIQSGSRVWNSIKAGIAQFSSKSTSIKTTTYPNGSKPEITAGSKLNVRVIEIIAGRHSSFKTGAQVSLKPGQIIHGTVNSKLPSGFPVVDTMIGRLVLETGTQIPVGSQLSLELLSLPRIFTHGPNPSHNLLAPIFSGELPALKDTLDFIGNLPPNIRAEVPNPAVPRTGSQLTSSLLFFLSALKGGSPSAWLQEQTSTFLGSERPELLGRLNEEFGQIARLFNEGPSGDWRTTLIPIFDGIILNNLQFSFRQGESTDDNNGDEDDARFIIDVTLSKLGRVQLDGLVISKKNKFDLFIRSEGPFPGNMKKDINVIFSDFVEISGVKGDLIFQSQKYFVDIPLVSRLPDKDNNLVI